MSFYYYLSEDMVEREEYQGGPSLILYHTAGSYVMGKARALSYIFAAPPEGFDYLKNIEVLKTALRDSGAGEVSDSAGSIFCHGQRASHDSVEEKNGVLMHKGTLFYSEEHPELLPMDFAGEGLTMSFLIGAVKYRFEKSFGKCDYTDVVI